MPWLRGICVNLLEGAVVYSITTTALSNSNEAPSRAHGLPNVISALSIELGMWFTEMPS